MSNEPEIEELGPTLEEIIEDEKNRPSEKRYRCFNCGYIYSKNYRISGICTYCHTKHTLQLVDVDFSGLEKIDNEPNPNIDYYYLD
jgi:hypothetical protein